MNKKDLEFADYINKLSDDISNEFNQIEIRQKNSYNITHGKWISFDIEKQLCKAHLNGKQDALRDVIKFLSIDARSINPYNYTQFGDYLKSKGWEI